MAKDQSGAILVAFVAGAVAGAAVALLFAPASGDETRDYLGQRAREGRSKAMNAFEKARDQYQRTADGEQEA
jgi:gas vesicle protein